LSLVNAYRTRGHLFTKTNPVRERRHYFPTLDLENFGLAEGDLETVFQGRRGAVYLSRKGAKLAKTEYLLSLFYCF